MSKRTIYFILAAIFAFIYIEPYINPGRCNIFSGRPSTFCDLNIWLLLIALPAGSIFFFLALFQKGEPHSKGILPSKLYTNVNPVILLFIGALLVIVPFIDKFLGYKLFGAHIMLYFGGIILLSAGIINLFKKKQLGS